MGKDKGDIYLSKDIKERTDRDGGYFMEICSLLEDYSRNTLAPLSYDYLNPGDKIKGKLNPFMKENPRVVIQCPSSMGRIYIETATEKRYTPMFFLKIPYLYTEIYVYTAPEYEYHKEETQVFSLKKSRLKESEVL